MIAVAAVLVSGELAAEGVRAQLDDRIRAAGAGSNSALIEVEAEQLALLREITFTSGVGTEIQAKDSEALNRLVTPLQVNSGVPMVDVVRPGGVVVLAVRSAGAPRPVASRKGIRAIAQAIAGADGSRGGRFSVVTTLQRAPVLLTIGPVLNGSKAVGAVMVMTPLADVLARLSADVGATLTTYNLRGDATATTSRTNPAPLSRDQTAVFHRGSTTVRETSGGTREMLGRLVVDHTTGAILGVSIHDDSSETELAVDGIGLAGLLLAGIALALVLRRRAASSHDR
ncbi:MAG: hypothetical protein ACRDWE_01370 [Acidimicrobiales bacterium]